MFSHFQVQFQKCYFHFSSLSQYEIILKQCKSKHINLFCNLCDKYIYFYLFLHLLLFMLFTQKAKISLRRWYLLKRRERLIWQSRKQGILPRGIASATAQGQIIAVSVKDTESEELKSLLTKVKEESEKVGLKLNIQKTKFMVSRPITSWKIDGETVETVADFIFLGSKITADGVCSPEMKRRLLLGRKVMTNLDSIFKSRDITLPTKVHLVAMVFPVVMYGCESWTVKKDEHRRIDAFELWCWRRLLRVPWTARRPNQPF